MPKSIHGVMSEYKHGDLHSGSKGGPKVKDRKQAIAIALSEQKEQKEKKGLSGKLSKWISGRKGK